jgi:hypothetical protein
MAKLSYWPKTKFVLVSDETKTLTIAYWPKVELVAITPTVSGTVIKDLLQPGFIPFPR